MRFKTKFCWWPVPLYRMNDPIEGTYGRLEHIGYTWMIRAPLTNNINLGWIHVLGSIPYEYTCLERVTARAIKVCKQINPTTISPLNPQGDYVTMTPEELLAFEQATLKSDYNQELQQIILDQEKAIEQLTVKLAMQDELLEEAAEDVESWGNYAGCYFKEKWNLARDVAKYRDAAKTTQADVEAWEATRHAELKEKYDINEASNKAVELALEDVPYKGSYADGVELLKETIEQLQRENDGFELFGHIEPRKNFEQMEAEAVYIVGEKDFDGCTVALYRRKE